MRDPGRMDTTPEVESLLSELYGAPAPAPAFVARLERQLVLEAARSSAARPAAGLRPLTAARPLAWAALAVALILVTGWGILRLLPPPPAAATPSAPPEKLGPPARPLEGKPSAYLPQVGFVDLSAARLLAQPVRQEHEGQSLAITQGVEWDGKITLWVEMGGEPFTLDGAWLALPDGQRSELDFWGSPAGSPRAATLQFPALPAGMDEATLSLPQGWRLPLRFAAASESGLPPANLPAEACRETPGLRLCALAAAADAAGVHVLLGASTAEAGAELVQPLAQPNPLDQSDGPALLTSGGERLPLAGEPPASFSSGAAQALQTLDFAPPPAASDGLILHVPAVTVQVPLGAFLQVDLGPDPQPGQEIAVGLPVQVGTQTVVFDRAVLSGDGVETLALELSSAPLEVQDGRLVTQIALGSPDGTVGNYGFGFNPPSRTHNLQVELIAAGGQRRTGLLTLPLPTAQVTLSGPFDIPIRLPDRGIEPAKEPVTVDPQAFSPPPVPTPRPLEGFAATGRAVQPGELLFTLLSGGQTSLYAAGLDGNGPAEAVATLPGHVYSVQAAQSGQMIYYMTADNNADGYLENATLYAWNLAETAPRPALGPLTLAFNLAWSPDGRYLYYETQEDRQGTAEKRWLLDLACAAAAEGCTGQARQLSLPEGLTLYGARWSPDGAWLAFGGVEASTPSGMGDVWGLEAALAGQGIGLAQWTRTPDSNEFPLGWSPDSQRVLFSDERSTNVWGLAWLEQATGVVERLPDLPFYGAASILSPDGQSLAMGGTPDGLRENAGVYLWRLDSGEYSPLVKDVTFQSLAFASNGQHLSFIANGGKTLYLADLTRSELFALFDAPAQAQAAGSELTWAGWVR